MTNQTIQDILYLLGAWERGANAEEYANEIETIRTVLDPWNTLDMAYRPNSLSMETWVTITDK